MRKDLAVDVLMASVCPRRGLVFITAEEHFAHVKFVRKKFKV